MKKEVDLLSSDHETIAFIHCVKETTPGVKLLSVELYFWGDSKSKTSHWGLNINGINTFLTRVKYEDAKKTMELTIGTSVVPLVQLHNGTIINGPKIIIS